MSRDRPLIAALAAWLTALLALVALGAAPAMADEGHDHGGGTKPLPADADRCDLGFNTKAYNDVIRQGKVNDPALQRSAFPRALHGTDPVVGGDLLRQAHAAALAASAGSRATRCTRAARRWAT